MRPALLATILAAVGATGALAQSGRPRTVGPGDLAARPDQFVGREIEVAHGFCGNDGGSGFQCATDGPVYVMAPSLGPAAALTRVNAECGGLDVVEKSPTCRFRLRFTPRSHEISTEIEQGRRIRVFRTDAIRAF